MKARGYINICLMGISVVTLGFCIYKYSNPTLNVSGIEDNVYDSSSNYIENIIYTSGADSAEILNTEYKDGKEVVSLNLIKNTLRKKVTVKVEDNSAPMFTKYEESIVLKKGSSKKYILGEFKASDVSGNLEYFIIGDIDYNKEGKYNVEVCCSDANGNTVSVPVEVIIAG